jgi:hypothetical protein
MSKPAAWLFPIHARVRAALAMTVLLASAINITGQRTGSRVLEDKVPKHLPITIKLKPEKEKQFLDLNNESWVRDLEFELKNTGDKPIYFMQFNLAPDFGKPPSERSLALTIVYGRQDLITFENPLLAEDMPIKPGESVSLRIRAEEIKGWDYFKRAENWPEAWSKPAKVTLYFERMRFGDGTGFDGGDGAPYPKG